MSTKPPVIKFSPFQALLIGEKNKVVKRQPVKNAIFVARINHYNKAFNLRDLFDVERDTVQARGSSSSSSNSNEQAVFKMPQRVREYLKSRRLSRTSTHTKRENDDFIYYDIKKEKAVKGTNSLKHPTKNSKLKSNKVKFKRKNPFVKSKFENRIVRKFHSHARRTEFIKAKRKKLMSRLVVRELKQRNFNKHLLRGKDGKFISKEMVAAQTKRRKLMSRLVLKKKKKKRKLRKEKIHPNRHMLRGKDGKFISKKDHECEGGRSKVSVYLKRMYRSRSKRFQTGVKRGRSFNKVEPTCRPNLDDPDSPTDWDTWLGDLTSSFYTDGRRRARLPTFPGSCVRDDFDDDPTLLDIVYENFPKSFKFHGEAPTAPTPTPPENDFSDALRRAQILSPVKSLKMYEKKRNGFFDSKKLTVIFNNHIPYIKLNRLDDEKCHHQRSRNGFSSAIDEPKNKNSHLITTKSFECVFLRFAEGKEILVGNFVKPFLQNSWFGRLPEV